MDLKRVLAVKKSTPFRCLAQDARNEKARERFGVRWDMGQRAWRRLGASPCDLGSHLATIHPCYC